MRGLIKRQQFKTLCVVIGYISVVAIAQRSSNWSAEDAEEACFCSVYNDFGYPCSISICEGDRHLTQECRQLASLSGDSLCDYSDEIQNTQPPAITTMPTETPSQIGTDTAQHAEEACLCFLYEDFGYPCDELICAYDAQSMGCLWLAGKSDGFCSVVPQQPILPTRSDNACYCVFLRAVGTLSQNYCRQAGSVCDNSNSAGCRNLAAQSSLAGCSNQGVQPIGTTRSPVTTRTPMTTTRSTTRATSRSTTLATTVRATTSVASSPRTEAPPPIGTDTTQHAEEACLCFLYEDFGYPCDEPICAYDAQSMGCLWLAGKSDGFCSVVPQQPILPTRSDNACYCVFLRAVGTLSQNYCQQAGSVCDNSNSAGCRNLAAQSSLAGCSNQGVQPVGTTRSPVTTRTPMTTTRSTTRATSRSTAPATTVRATTPSAITLVGVEANRAEEACFCHIYGAFQYPCTEPICIDDYESTGCKWFASLSDGNCGFRGPLQKPNISSRSIEQACYCVLLSGLPTLSEEFCDAASCGSVRNCAAVGVQSNLPECDSNLLTIAGSPTTNPPPTTTPPPATASPTPNPGEPTARQIEQSCNCYRAGLSCNTMIAGESFNCIPSIVQEGQSYDCLFAARRHPNCALNNLLSDCPSGPRVRKDVRSLDSSERRRLVNAFRSLQETPSRDASEAANGLSRYDSFTRLHHAQVRLAHGTLAFLIWHREYIYRFETALREIDSGVTLPYWDFSSASDADDPQNSQIFGADLFGGGNYGFISSSVFQNLEVGYPNRHNVLRFVRTGPNREGSGFDPSRFDSRRHINSLVNDGSLTFRDFALAIESLHASPHVAIGGQDEANRGLGQIIGDLVDATRSPSDPTFYMIHSGVDKFLEERHQAFPSRAHEYDGTPRGTFENFLGGLGVSVRHGMFKQCVVYEERSSSVRFNADEKHYRAISENDMASVSRQSGIITDNDSQYVQKHLLLLPDAIDDGTCAAKALALAEYCVVNHMDPRHFFKGLKIMEEVKLRAYRPDLVPPPSNEAKTDSDLNLNGVFELIQQAEDREEEAVSNYYHSTGEKPNQGPEAGVSAVMTVDEYSPIWRLS